MANYSRPASGFRFKNEGMNTVFAPDALPEFKYPYLQNIRSYLSSMMQSRPGVFQAIAGPANPNNLPVLALEPTIGVYKINGSIFHNGASIQSGFAAGLGCSIIPYRPNASPNAYDYVFDDNKAVKVAVQGGSVLAQKAGIAEPQVAPDIVAQPFIFRQPINIAANWTAAGTAAAPADASRLSETIGSALPDPQGGFANRTSLQIVSAAYSQWMLVHLSDSGFDTPVLDVIPPLNNGTALTIKSIFYFTGNTGHCVIVPNIAHGSLTLHGIGGIQVGGTQDEPLLSETGTNVIAGLKRGAIVRLNNAENVVVWSVSVGPDGSVSFETSTTLTHNAGELLVGIQTIIVAAGDAGNAGATITSSEITSAIAAGIGTLTYTFGFGTHPFDAPMGIGGVFTNTAQSDDYFHVSLNIDNLANLTEIKILIDVGDGSFTQNYFYFTVRPSDIQPAISNTTTQLAIKQLLEQRALIDANIDPTGATLGQIDSPSSLQTLPGTSQWTEIIFPISAFTRVGNNQQLTLNNAVKMQILVNCTAGVNIAFGSIYTGGGGAVDVGDSVTPILYRVRPRSSVTGAIGNPSPATRYGVSPRRQPVEVFLPSAAYDGQIDTWDIFRFGGNVTSWRYVGSAKSTDATFIDNTTEFASANSQVLQFDRLEPFPSIGPPITASSATIVGTTMVAVFPTANVSPAAAATLSQLGQLLPNNEFNIGQQVFTLWTRPVFLSTVGNTQTYLFQFVENAGSQVNPSVVFMQEPNLAAQGSKAVFGPDSNGVLFAIQAGAASNGGTGLRAGLVQWTNTNDPDSASDANTSDVCPPTEPLLNGWVVADTPIVLSAIHAWRGFSGQDAEGNLTYNFRGIPVARGLAAQFGICSDGAYIYYVAEDGIRRTAGGADESITDDIYNIFPHEGIQAANVVYAGQTVFAPSYQFAQNFRLAVVNNFLFFDYLDITQTYRTLVCDLRTMSWSVDVYSPQNISIHAGITLPPSNNQAPATAVLNQPLFMGDVLGNIYNESNTAGEAVACVVVTREEVVGDIRANKMFGDAAIDMIPAGGNVTVTPVFLGTLFGTTTVIAGGVATRPASPPTINLVGEQLKRTMGLKLSWTDTNVQSQLHMWQIAYLTQPEDITNRIGDWDNAGTPGAKFFQGFLLESDTLNAAKQISIRSGDDLTIKQTFTVTANGQQQKVFSFTTPFIAHLVRYEPDSAVWRMFSITWIFQPTPEAALNWITQPTGHQLEGFKHVPFVNFAYNAPAPVTLAITADGVTVSVVLPATTGFQKIPVRIPPNKGQVYQYSATSAQPFQVWDDDIEILVGEWGRSTPLKTVKVIGSTMGERATV